MKDAKGHGSEKRGGFDAEATAKAANAARTPLELRRISAKAVAEQSAAHAAGVNKIGQYPELRAHVNAMLPGIVTQINQRASSTDSKMPYKSQWILEELISELQKRV